MKRKKIIKLIIWGIGLVCIIGIANFIITSGTVERNSADYEKAKIKNWNAVMAKSSNKKVINLQVDNKKIEDIYSNVFFTSSKEYFSCNEVCSN